MLPETFLHALPIIETIENEGYKAYYVGGCVRDYLLHKKVGDIDIATSARPERIQALFPKVYLVGVDHGTVVVRHEGVSYEVTTFRLDGNYTDKRHPDHVHFIDRIDEDLKRRDFTINAMAMDKEGNIIDLFDGKRDLEKKLIRTVGNGEKRFSEDPLRIIRAVRFSSQLGFTISNETIAHMEKTKQDIDGLAVERIMNEMAKLFSGKFVNRGVKYMKETNIHAHLPVFKEDTELFQLLPEEIAPMTSFGQVIALFHLIKPKIDIAYWAREWKCSNQVKKEAELLVWAYNYYKTNGLDSWLVYRLGKQYEEGLINLIDTLKAGTVSDEEMKNIRKILPIHHKKQLAVNGYDLMEWYPEKKRGPWLKKALQDVESKVVHGTIENDKEKIKDWLKWNLREIN